MKKTVFTILAFLLIALCSTFVLAKDDNAIRDAGSAVSNVVKDATSDIQQDVQDVGNGVKNGVENVGNDIKNGARNIGSDMENGLNRTAAAITDNNNNDNNDYMATRTNAQVGGFMGMGATAWTWVALAVAGIIIVALVWYYATQNNPSSHNRD